MFATHARVATENPSTQLKKLCRHFAHKLEVSFDDTQGEIRFPFGLTRLEIRDQTLVLTGQADDEARLEQLKKVTADHLLRFAHKESLTVDWQPGAPAIERPHASEHAAGEA
ncbi:DUF2218 domain-containing protein [Halomonas sp. YLGW01]|uniref:DUF2218 domain-containing protein n=1 Tax=Halomonas sp. YLGW01 TaxID=2773308 RepID=UPI0017815069|nr:DUF2218 domain-containing protein [Halomonas sp. YLGW01]